MPAVARFDLKMDNDEKELLARAAALQGTTMAAFVRVAAKEKARELIERESLLVMSASDFGTFMAALNGAFAPNPALKRAMTVAREIKRA